MASKRFRLEIMPRAAEDMEDIYGYIYNEFAAPSAAYNFMEKIEKAFLRLREMPESCPLCEDEILRNKGYRKLIVNNYTALYIINKKEQSVLIMRVFHNRQNSPI